MAKKDVEQYYFSMLAQYLEEKQNLVDFEDALKNGCVTEEQMAEAIETVRDLENNYYRLAYIMFLLDMPNRKSKKAAYLKQHKIILTEMQRLGVDCASVKQENVDALIHFKAALKALRDKGER